MSGVTDPYQPVERRLQLTRRCLEVLGAFRNPVVIVTKSALVTRDVDVLTALARDNAAPVFLSITTLDGHLARLLEPRASQPTRRLAAVDALAQAGIPVGVLVAPVIPGLTDHELPAILTASARVGAQSRAMSRCGCPTGWRRYSRTGCVNTRRPSTRKSSSAFGRCGVGSSMTPALGSACTAKGSSPTRSPRCLRLVAAKQGYSAATCSCRPRPFVVPPACNCRCSPKSCGRGVHMTPGTPQHSRLCVGSRVGMSCTALVNVVPRRTPGEQAAHGLTRGHATQPYALRLKRTDASM